MVSEVEQRSRLFLSIVTVASIYLIILGIAGIWEECPDYRCLHNNGVFNKPILASQECEHSISFHPLSLIEPSLKAVAKKEVTSQKSRTNFQLSKIENLNSPELLANSTKQVLPEILDKEVHEATYNSLEESTACLRDMVWIPDTRSGFSYQLSTKVSLCINNSDSLSQTCLERQANKAAVFLGGNRVYKWQAFGCLHRENESFYEQRLERISNSIKNYLRKSD